MKVMQVDSNNYNPQFGKVILKEGGEKIIELLKKDGSESTLKDLFKEAEENFAADIFVGKDGISVLDKLTGKKYFPSGNLLKKEGGDLAVFKEAELLDGSSKQELPKMDARDTYEYLYLRTKTVWQGLFKGAKNVVEFFQPKKESSYIIRQERKRFGGKELYESGNDLYYGDENLSQIVPQFNAALQIAYDIKFQVEHALVESGKSVDEFVKNLAK